MILVDTSVWIDHLRLGEGDLEALLNSGQVLTHPFVIGELACGNLRNRTAVLGLLTGLPRSRIASQDEVLYFIETNNLMGQGIGFIDAHLLAATAMSDTSHIWTRDKRLGRVAADLGIALRSTPMQ